MFRILDFLETSDEAAGFYETSVISYQLPRHQEDLNLHQHRYDNLQSRFDVFFTKIIHDIRLLQSTALSSANFISLPYLHSKVQQYIDYRRFFPRPALYDSCLIHYIW
jgi:hypothetical protein